MSGAAPAARPAHTPRRAPSTATVLAELGLHACMLSGPAPVIHEALSAARAPRRYDRDRRAFVISRSHADDVLAALELQAGVSVERRTVSA